MVKDEWIYLRGEKRKEVLSLFGISESTLSQALNFHRNSIKSRRIRSIAVNRYNGYYFSDH